LAVMFLVLAAEAFPEYSKGGNPDQKMTENGFESRIAKEDSSGIPIEPETIQWLFNNSDVIAYVEIISVQSGAGKRSTLNGIWEMPRIFPEQHCKACVLWVIKGDEYFQNRTISIVKEPSRYYLSEREKRVMYLRKENRGSFCTIDRFGGEHRLVSAVCNMRNLNTDAKSGGVIVSVYNGHESAHPKVHVLKGRHPSSLNMNDRDWKTSLVKSANMGEFNIWQISLQKGLYTVLLEIKGTLYSHTRLTNGYYACVIVGMYRWWEPLYFGPKSLYR